MGAAMSMMMGGGDKPMYELVLCLGSTRAPAGGAPAADHFMPAGAALGASIPLVIPRIPQNEDQAMSGERPKGRLLIYWGCGASIPHEWQVRVTNSKTYGDWPNA